MARVYGIKKRLQENNVDKNLIKEEAGFVKYQQRFFWYLWPQPGI